MLVFVVAIPFVVIGSVAVWQLSGTDARRLGAVTAASEPVALVWRGPWSINAKYAPGQVVSYEGSSYVAETAHVGRDPTKSCPSDCPWSLMATRGRDGSRGPSDVYRYSANSQTGLSDAFATVASIPLPAGNYAVTARLIVQNLASGAEGVQCQIPSVDSLVLSVPADSFDLMVFVGSLQATTASNLVLECRSFSSDRMSTWYPRIVAVSAGSLTTPP